MMQSKVVLAYVTDRVVVTAFDSLGNAIENGQYARHTPQRAEAERAAFRASVTYSVGLERWWDGEPAQTYTAEEAKCEWDYMLAPEGERKKVKLPKQWKHWCYKNGLRPSGYRMDLGREEWFYLKGKGHVWRVNCYAQFQCGDIHEEFDRWALSLITESPLPQSEAEFAHAVDWLARCHAVLRQQRDEENKHEGQ